MMEPKFLLIFSTIITLPGQVREYLKMVSSIEKVISCKLGKSTRDASECYIYSYNAAVSIA